MNLSLANRVSALTPSTTLAITAKAKEMKAQGIDVIGLGAGEPDFNTPQHIIQAAYESLIEGHTKYTPSGGTAQLKEAVINKFKQDQNLTYKPSEIIVTSGAKHALYTLFQVLLNEGDEVIIPTPYWVSYPEQVKLAGGNPVIVEGRQENSYKITPEQLTDSITEKTKAVIINSPSNPTGMVYSSEELKAIGQVCLEKNILIVSDEIYEKLIYDGNSHTSIAEISEDLKEQTIIINGVSKSHSMTGWRIGYAAGNETIIKAMTNLASHSTSNPTTTSQYGAVAAYMGDQQPVEVMRKSFEERLNIVFEKLNNIPGFDCLKPQGAFYLFPNVKEAARLTGYDNVDIFVQALLEDANVAVIPGSGFGSEDNIRLSYATSLEQIEKAIERIHEFVLSKSK
ncbi:pyridoxal phosphate-dependent aminotransferase [Bacillus haikouensis]|jgi:aspartate aminotransferase|uniref:pyridoxal phosphate-dependent aminotransferase n=1 Tax=Bacillus haikouensis TaxID=1510468 RepID=UPI00155628A0|nr:pyridoxal phosphate-dependent aminotransferase [Bacillus haikouensis]NQD64521.1 pyridoxal phosphate-dependent aminotransferase [Bacillus haikouensis]